MTAIVAEKDFLIGLALRQYNDQYNKSFVVDDCDIVSIPNNIKSDLAYEIVNMRTDDFFRLRMYLNIAEKDEISPYRIEVDGSGYTYALGDEVFVSSGTVDRYYRDSGTYGFLTITEEMGIDAILSEDGIPIISEDGIHIVSEGI